MRMLAAALYVTAAVGDGWLAAANHNPWWLLAGAMMAFLAIYQSWKVGYGDDGEDKKGGNK